MVYVLLILGLFTSANGILEYPREIRDSDVKIFFFDIQGILTNISNPNDLANTPFSPKKDTFFYVHGWLANVNSSLTIPKALVLNYDVNIFVVDWDNIAKDSYVVVFEKLEMVGKLLASLINDLVSFSGLNLNTTTLVGHSFGAHVVGITGRFLKKEVAYIVGLDPAGPLVSVTNTSNRLTPDSAQYVEAIHTSAGTAGYKLTIGQSDYYPNGGENQPSCLDNITCSHVIAIDYYADSLLGVNFKARKCDSYEDYQNGKCDEREESWMGGYPLDKKAKGKFFLNTNNGGYTKTRYHILITIIISKIICSYLIM